MKGFWSLIFPIACFAGSLHASPDFERDVAVLDVGLNDEHVHK
jgi:hypothetical protein